MLLSALSIRRCYGLFWPSTLKRWKSYGIQNYFVFCFLSRLLFYFSITQGFFGGVVCLFCGWGFFAGRGEFWCFFNRGGSAFTFISCNSGCWIGLTNSC